MTRQSFIQTVRQLIADGKTAEALALMREKAGDFDSSLVTDATLLESRYTNAFNDFTMKGILPRDDYDRTVAQINYAMLEMLEKLEKSATISSGGVKNKNSGRLLHNIPGIMPVGKESRCIVRIAYDDEMLLRDLKTDANTTIQSVRIAEVMGVELVDFNETPAFNIRTITEEEQFISSDDYTQWLFMVKALREGKYPLTLKVTVIEEVNGKERKRDIVLEKEIFIISQLEQPSASPAPLSTKDIPPQPSVTHFEDTTVRLNYVVTDEDRAAAPTQTSKRFSFSGIASTIAVIALALTGWVVFQKFNTSPTVPIVIANEGENKGNGKNGNTPNVVVSDTSLKGADSPVYRDTVSSQIVENNNNKNTDVKNPKIETQKPKIEIIANKTKDIKDNNAAKNPNATKPNGSGSVIAKKGKPTQKTKPKTDTPKVITPQQPNTEPQIKLGDVKVITTNPATDLNAPKEPEAVVKTFRVRLILKGEMKKAEISVDGQSVDKYLKKNIWGTPQYIEFKSSKERHTITFKRGNVSCSVENVLVENGNMTVEPCSF